MTAEQSQPTPFPRQGILQISSAPLMAASFLIADGCHSINDFFMYCKRQCPDPSSCLPLGIAVRDCAEHIFNRLAKSNCREEFGEFWRCLDFNSHMPIYCREEEMKFYECLHAPSSGIEDLKKGLWRGDCYDHPAGLKSDDAYPERGRFWYRYHVWNYKRKYPEHNKEK
jgi:hypothetical protein